MILFGGFISNMSGIKPAAVYGFYQESGVVFALFGYSGHGYSSGDFADYTISDWQKKLY